MKLYQRGSDGYPTTGDQITRNAYGLIPDAVYFLNAGRYEIPATIHGWQWSPDFGKWSALATFADGWHGFTYPAYAGYRPATEESAPVLTLVPAIIERTYVDLEFVTTTEHDDDPDTSWLEQTDDQMGDGYEEHAQERISAYQRGDWHMIGVVVEATLTDDDGRTEEFRQSVWGIESDADQSYINEVAQDLTRELVFDLKRFGLEYEWIAQFSDVIAGDLAAQRGEVLALAAD